MRIHCAGLCHGAVWISLACQTLLHKTMHEQLDLTVTVHSLSRRYK